MNDKDIAALETVENLKNYNKYIFTKIFDKDFKERVLDFGCGFGTFCEFIFKNFNFEIIGYEVNENAKIELKKKNVQYIDSLRAYNKKFETVVSLNVLEHIEDDKKAISDIYKLLNDGGKLILYLPHSMRIWTTLDEDVGHFRRYSKEDLIKKLKDGGFEIISCEYVDFIGWLTLLMSKVFKLNLDFNDEKIFFYDKFIFPTLKYLDIIFKKLTGKNILLVAIKGKKE